MPKVAVTVSPNLVNDETAERVRRVYESGRGLWAVQLAELGYDLGLAELPRPDADKAAAELVRRAGLSGSYATTARVYLARVAVAGDQVRQLFRDAQTAGLRAAQAVQAVRTAFGRNGPGADVRNGTEAARIIRETLEKELARQQAKQAKEEPVDALAARLVRRAREELGDSMPAAVKAAVKALAAWPPVAKRLARAGQRAAEAPKAAEAAKVAEAAEATKAAEAAKAAAPKSGSRRRKAK